MNFSPFHFKKFSVFQEDVAHAVGTDGVLLGAWADVDGANSILDIGTGTGLIALMLAQRTVSEVHISAIDVHPGSVACAQQNFSNSPWPARLKVHETAVQQFALESGSRFDLIVSNPPYFSETTVSPDAERRLGRSIDNLSIHDLLVSVLPLLSPVGKCCFILPEKEGKRLCEMAVPLGLYCTHEVQVRAREGKPVERLLLQLEREPGRFRRSQLQLHGEGGGYSAVFLAMTAPFYL